MIMIKHTLRVSIIIAFLTISTLGLSSLVTTSNLSQQNTRSVSIVTGSRGYLGRQIIHELLENPIRSNKNDDHDSDSEVDSSDSESDNNNTADEVICLVRETHVKEEELYWKTIMEDGDNINTNTCLKVMPYDMLDGGTTLSEALEYTFNGNDKTDVNCCVYHVASIFSPRDDHDAMASENVKGTIDLMNTIVKVNTPMEHSNNNIRVVLTSSTAAVRGGNQKPLNNKWYTHMDWNTESEQGKNWGNSYQWSKAESEKKAWEIAKSHGVSMVSICPSFIFGPPKKGQTSSSYSIQLVNSWVMGDAPVQSRLCVDIRDVAKAHRLAGTLPIAIGERLIVSSEARISSQKTSDEFQCIAKENGFDPDKIHPDTNFDGGAIKIGEKEVDSVDRLRDILGLTCRPVEETMRDMARTLFEMKKASTDP
jgi:nucleoside-diphosphate-sugar epimerase